MKQTATIILSLIIIAGCRKDAVSTSTQPVNEMIDTANASLVYRGVFINGPYGSISGVSKIYVQSGDMYSLVLDSFNVSNGPDLHVYLSKEVQPVNFIDLGKLRSTSGTQVYNITGMPDFLEYKYALIHCQQLNHLFGSSSLQ